MIERLRSQVPTDWCYKLGFNSGERYARDNATLEEFKEYEGISEDMIYDGSEFTLPKWEEEELALQLEDEAVESTMAAYRRGFVARMMEVWEQVKDRL